MKQQGRTVPNKHACGRAMSHPRRRFDERNGQCWTRSEAKCLIKGLRLHQPSRMGSASPFRNNQRLKRLGRTSIGFSWSKNVSDRIRFIPNRFCTHFGSRAYLCGGLRVAVLAANYQRMFFRFTFFHFTSTLFESTTRTRALGRTLKFVGFDGPQL